MDSLHGFLVSRVIPALQAGHDGEALACGHLASGADHVDPVRIDGVGLLDKNVLSGCDRSLKVQRVKLGGVGDDHHIRAFDDVLVAIEALEAVIVIHRHLFGVLQLQRGPFFLHSVQPDIGHRHDPNSFVGIHGVHRGGFAPPPAADHAYPDRVAARGVAAERGGG